MINRTEIPQIKDAVEFAVKIPPYETYQLDNGIPVYVVQAAEQETLQLEWIFDAGNWYESANMIASTVNAVLKNGTARHTSQQLNEMVEYYGAFLSTRCNHEFASLTLHCLEKHVQDLLPIVREILSEASFPENELDIYCQNKKQQLAVNLRKCDFVANQYIDKYLFGEYHPYGRHTTMEALDTLQRDGLYAFYSKYYSFSDCKIFVAGKLPANFEGMLNKIFGNDEWNGRQELLQNDYPLQPALEKKYRIDNDPDGVQGAIRIGRPFPNRYHPDVPKMQVLNTLLGGYFGSRLMNNIREDKGYTYGIFSGLYLYNKAGSLNISTEAGRDVSEAAVEEIYKEMEGLAREPVPEEELSLVRNYMIGSILGDLDGSFKVIRRWKNLILSGLDEQYFNGAVQTIKSVTAEQLQELAQKYFVPEEFYELVVV
ncbi:MAG TPA: pitrilysin family protein [Chitinophagaceae bacterium]|nr:pitrilysin family protein [Chitinophagaceae bacterium]